MFVSENTFIYQTLEKKFQDPVSYSLSLKKIFIAKKTVFHLTNLDPPKYSDNSAWYLHWGEGNTDKVIQIHTRFSGNMTNMTI